MQCTAYFLKGHIILRNYCQMVYMFQSVIFHVERHPVYTWFEQCVTFNFFPTPAHELAYNLFNLITVYLLPLIIITASYSGILYTISKNARRARGRCFTDHYKNTPMQRFFFFSSLKIENFTRKKKFYILNIFAQNMHCGYTLEPPRRGGSNEYIQCMFWIRNKKIRYTPANPSSLYKSRH